MSEQRDHLPVLDGARGLATVVVVLFHCRRHFLPPVLAGPDAGRAAVCFFFMLSGFLMAYLYAGRRFDRFEIASYVGHRMARVLPLYLLIVLGSFALQGSDLWVFPMSRRDVVLHLGFIRGNLSLWTIPVEVSFYGLLLIIWRDAQRGRPVRPFVMIGIASASIAIALFLATGRFLDVLPFWCHFFLFGAGLGLFVVRHPQAFARLRKGPGWIGWAALGLFFFSISRLRALAGFPELPGCVDPLTMGASALLFASALFALGPLKLLTARPMRWLGETSYGIYIYHFVVIQNLVHLPYPRYVVFPLVLIVTLAVAAVSYYWFEAPLRRKAVKYVASATTRWAGKRNAVQEP